MSGGFVQLTSLSIELEEKTMENNHSSEPHNTMAESEGNDDGKEP